MKMTKIAMMIMMLAQGNYHNDDFDIVDDSNGGSVGYDSGDDEFIKDNLPPDIPRHVVFLIKLLVTWPQKLR